MFVLSLRGHAGVAEQFKSGPPCPAEVAIHGLHGKSKGVSKILELVRVFGKTQDRVLITGESGTGKELVARALHAESPRREKPFIAVNCGALSENLILSELFGHVKGAFTGADRDRVGRFEEANEGTLFLDEIAELPNEVQASLLRALSTGTIQRVGSSKEIVVNVRVIAATHQDLPGLVETKSFRGDLFHRLNVLSLNLPPLRARRDDIEILANLIVARVAESRAIEVPVLDPVTKLALEDYSWPGNIRELENAITHAVTMAQGQSVILPEHLPEYVMTTTKIFPLVTRGPDETDTAFLPLKAREKNHILAALKLTQSSRQDAAQLLGIALGNFQTKCRELIPLAERDSYRGEPVASAEALNSFPTLATIQREHIIEALRRANGSSLSAAKLLEMGQPTLSRLRGVLGIKDSDYK